MEAVVAGLDGEVVIHRDEWGIPHAKAVSAHDAFLAQGFVQAQDRLGQLDYDRRRAYGRWAEVAGRGALSFDVFARRCGLAAAARREYDALAAEARMPLDAFASGVNALLDVGAPPPPDMELAGVAPERWEPWDCCAVFLVRHVAFANWQRKLWRGRLAAVLGAHAVAHLDGEDPGEIPLIVPPGAWWRAGARDERDLESVVLASNAFAESASGSNAWALAGSRTASGLPLLAGDPHRLVETPGVYAQCHLACPEFDAIGLAFVGVPGFPHFGQSDHVAWCVTNANGDYQDLYVERFATDGSQRYESSGSWVDPVRRTETIVVRDGEPVTIDCLETRHGPVVFGDPASGHAIALRSTALVEPSPGLSVLGPMLRANDVEELDDIMRAWVDPANNFVSADDQGNIAYRTIGRIPVRSRATAWGPVPGWVDDHEWLGVVPYDEMPRAQNPASGLIATANQRIVDDAYPHYLGADYARPDRARRLHERLDRATGADPAAMADVHRDRVSNPAAVWVDRLSRLDGADEWERLALDALRAWDLVMDPDSVAAAVYMVVRDAAGRLVAHDPRLEPLRSPVSGEPRSTFAPLEVRIWPWLTPLLANDDPTLLPVGSNWEQTLAAALADGVSVLRTALGDESAAWRWGALHVCAPRHPLSGVLPGVEHALDPPGVEMGGEWDTVFHAAHPAGNGFGVTTASVARYVFDLGDRASSAWIVPLGASGAAGDPHFADQQSAWAAGDLVPARPDLASPLDVAARLTPSTR